MVWEDDISYCTSGKDVIPELERLAGDTTDIYEWLEFEFYDQFWFCNN